jgi:glycosyltransferase involved in cell wall biosynthesis
MRFCAVANHHGTSLRHVIVAMDGRVSCRERLNPELDVRVIELGLSKPGPLATWRRLRAVLREIKPDVLLTHNWGSIEWALANAPPMLPPLARHIHVEDGFGPDERDRQLRRRVWARRLALRRSTVVLPSRTLLRLAEQIWRLAPAHLRYIPNGVDLTRFAPGQRPASRLNLPPGDGPLVGTVAALRPEKNIARLLRATALVPDLRLIVVGDGPERAPLEALASELGIASRVAFAGAMADPAPAYAMMDIFALSSDTEQMPLTILEAMAAGLPVAATDVGDVVDMVGAENVPFIVTRDETTLGAALGRLATNATLRQAVGTANQTQAATTFGQTKMFTAWGGVLGVGGIDTTIVASSD